MGSGVFPVLVQDRARVDDQGVIDARREALRKMGRYATYTAPALLALLATTRQAHAS